jgi:hypothetical protein
MSVTDLVNVAETEEQVCFGVEIRVPFSQAAQFAELLTGNDDDILLAAEQGIRNRLEMGADTEEVELVLGPQKSTLTRELGWAARHAA